MHPWVSVGERRIRFGVVHPLIGGAQTWTDLRETVERIESLGFDSYWFSDHPLMNPDCWTRIAALAATTHTIRLGTMVSCVYYRHPALLARIVADIDGISDGRVILGIGIGDFAAEFEQMGLPFPSVGDRLRALDEALHIIHGVWGSTPFTFAGEQFQVRDVRIVPAPVQEPGVPILIAGAGERVTLRQVAEFADACNFGPNPHTGGVFDTASIRAKLRVLDDHCDRLARPRRAVLRTHWAPPVILAASRAELERKAASLTADEHRFYGSHMLIATPAEAIRHYQSLIDAGMRYFVTHLRGDLDTAQLLAEQVVPALQLP